MSEETTQQKGDIGKVLKEATDGLLDDDSLSAIEEAFNREVEERASLRESAALEIQDQEYSEKLIHVLEAIDKDKTNKLYRVLEAVDKSNARKLVNVTKKYKKALGQDATMFKESMINHISDYLDLYLEETVPQEAINEAVKNKKAMSVLSALRGQLSVGSSLLDESVRTAVLDGKTQIDTLNESLKEKDDQVKVLNEQLRATAANLLLEKKSAGLPAKKKEYLQKVLANKTPEFINENFDYTLKLFEKRENDQLDILREEAMDTRVVKEEPKPRIIREKVEKPVQQANPYIEQLKKYN